MLCEEGKLLEPVTVFSAGKYQPNISDMNTTSLERKVNFYKVRLYFQLANI
jgi:hypothetical protein